MRALARGLGNPQLQLLEPFRGAEHTVALMRQYALEGQRDLSVRYLAEQAIQDIQSKDYLSEIAAIYYLLLGYFRYANDPRNVELVKRPGLLARQILDGFRPSIDCDDFITLYAAMALSVGREVRFATAAFQNAFYRGQRQYSHVYLQVREPRTTAWIVIDPVAAEDTGTMLRRIRAVKYWPV